MCPLSDMQLALLHTFLSFSHVDLLYIGQQHVVNYEVRHCVVFGL
jgi:hypothetical protein